MKTFISTVFLFLFSSYAFAWDRFEIVDDFSGKKSFGYIQKSSNNSGGYLIVSCDKKLKIEWDSFGYYAINLLSKTSGASAAKPALAAMPDGSDVILIKPDDDSVRREKGFFDNLHETFSQKNTAKFLAQIKNKSILKFKNEQLTLTGVFDISELNQVASEIKAVCN